MSLAEPLTISIVSTFERVRIRNSSVSYRVPLSCVCSWGSGQLFHRCRISFLNWQQIILFQRHVVNLKYFVRSYPFYFLSFTATALLKKFGTPPPLNQPPPLEKIRITNISSKFQTPGSLAAVMFVRHRLPPCLAVLVASRRAVKFDPLLNTG